MIKKIAVVAPYAKTYIDYVNAMPIDDDIEYTWAYSLDSIKGEKFNSYIKLRGYDELDDIKPLLAYIESNKLKDFNVYKSCLTEGSFTVDRKTLVFWSRPILEGVVARRMLRDLVMGSEFVITAQDLLDVCDVLPTHLVNEPVPDGIKTISTDIITITYKQ